MIRVVHGPAFRIQLLKRPHIVLMPLQQWNGERVSTEDEAKATTTGQKGGRKRRGIKGETENHNTLVHILIGFI